MHVLSRVRRARRALLAASRAGSVAALLAASLAGCSDTSTPEPPLAAPPGGCADGAVTVSDADALTAALDQAEPGDAIALRPGRYSGRFVIRASGTDEAPIELCGPRTAVLDGGDVEHGYTLHLDGASHWRLTGFTVSGGQKGVMLDAASHNELRALRVHDVGDEALHLRRGSSDNLVTRTEISTTGLRRPEYGEGIYVGSAVSNWCELTGCAPDRSDRNRLVRNEVSETTAEAIDVKEGTTGGEVVGNRLAAPRGGEADSLVDLKGNRWLVRDNHLAVGGLVGVQVHVVEDGWGAGNRLLGDVVTGDGLPVELVGAARQAGNVVG